MRLLIYGFTDTSGELPVDGNNDLGNSKPSFPVLNDPRASQSTFGGYDEANTGRGTEKGVLVGKFRRCRLQSDVGWVGRKEIVVRCPRSWLFSMKGLEDEGKI